MKIFLIVWSIAAFGWWVIALVLLAGGRQRNPVVAPAVRATMTVFKPLPPVSNEPERDILAEAIGSFVSQLKPGDEMIIGMDAAAAAGWSAKLQAWRTSWPSAQINVMTREIPRHCANPKIAWLQVLAPSACGEVWLWSDTDVTAPPGFLDAICAQLAACGQNAVTAPYRVQRVRQAHEMLDALFVNVEFLPGALLLGRLNHHDFAYGAATVFRAETFHAKGDWQKLGAALADDHKLGELLQPVALSSLLVSTIPNLDGWRAAGQHYYRWHKTVRWCRPSGYAALLMLMPAFGWTLASLFGGGKIFFLSGLGAVLGAEMFVAALACRLVGCRLPPATWLGVVLWPFARALTWLLVWLPLPVLWSGRQRAWFAPQQK